ncbi:MAG: PilZ domain-containing protein [Candidatus Omnitrophica bacterium]|nr:PilZ domain-containing protein [Candidatus Omnitrophota bacterium]
MEKRIYERISLPIKLTYEVKTRPQVIRNSVSKDISGSGICLSLKEKLLPKTALTISMIIGTEDNTINLNGKVVWNRRVEIIGDDGPIVYYDTGIELINADPININKIITHFYGKSF